jgi:hypothetical protein
MSWRLRSTACVIDSLWCGIWVSQHWEWMEGWGQQSKTVPQFPANIFKSDKHSDQQKSTNYTTTHMPWISQYYFFHALVKGWPRDASSCLTIILFWFQVIGRELHIWRDSIGAWEIIKLGNSKSRNKWF